MNTDDLMLRSDALAGQRILVTGGGSGLGLVIAEAALLLGAEVVICGRRAEVLRAAAEDLVTRHGGTVLPIACDIRSPEQIEGMLDRVWAELGPLTGLVNNAAGNFLSPTEALSPGGFDAISGIVFRGGFLVTSACGRRWIEQGLGASVVSVLASWIDGGVPFTVPSAMSKAGIEMMTRSLALEWGHRGIRLNCVAPGAFPTEGMQAHLRPGAPRMEPGGPDADNPLGRHGHMPELANLVTFLLAPGSGYVNGTTVVIDGGDHLVRHRAAEDRRHWTPEQWVREREQVREVDRADRE